MTSLSLAWTLIAGFSAPVLAHVCARFPLSWTAALIGVIAAVITAAGNRRMAAAFFFAALCMLLRLHMTDNIVMPGMEDTIEALTDVRRSVIDRIGLLVAEPQASFLAGVLTGERTDIPADITLQMQQTGLTHILAISGTNITLILVFLEHVLFFVPRRWKLAPLTGSIVVFTLFSGASASAVRACIMGMLQLVALQTGRPPVHRLLVGWTFVGMLLWNPQQLRDDAGFQLSFLAVIGLYEFQEPLKALLRRVPEAMGIRDALVMTLAAQLTASFWSAYVFGTLPLHSAILNILVAPLIPIAMLSGVGALGASMLSLTLGRMVMLPAWAALSGILWIGKVGAAFTSGILTGLEGSTTLLAVWVAFMGVLWGLTRRKNTEHAIVNVHAPA